MTNVSITSGCDHEPAEQFNEGADTYVRLCDPARASLIVHSEDRCLLNIKVDGNTTFSTYIEANEPYEFQFAKILKAKSSRGQLAASGLMALIGAGSKRSRAELPTDFLVEIRLTRTGAPLDGSYHFRLLSDETFDQRFAGYMHARVVDGPKPIFTRDARPIECLANETKCLACGTVIADRVAGCENGDCPTVTGLASTKSGGLQDTKPGS